MGKNTHFFLIIIILNNYYGLAAHQGWIPGVQPVLLGQIPDLA